MYPVLKNFEVKLSIYIFFFFFFYRLMSKKTGFLGTEALFEGKSPSQTAFDMYPVSFQNWVPYPVFWVPTQKSRSNVSNVCNRKVGFSGPYPVFWVPYPLFFKTGYRFLPKMLHFRNFLLTFC